VAVYIFTHSHRPRICADRVPVRLLTASNRLLSEHGAALGSH